MEDSHIVHVWNSASVCAKRCISPWKVQSSEKTTHVVFILLSMISLEINNLVHCVLILIKKNKSEMFTLNEVISGAHVKVKEK